MKCQDEKCQSQHVRFDSFRQVPLDDQPKTLRIAITDTAAQKAAEREQLRLENQLRESERLKTLRLIATGVAHDFNSLLSPILAHTELAMMDVGAVSPIQRNLAEVKVATGLAADLCRDMQSYLGTQSPELKPTDVRETIEKTVPLLRARLPESVQLSVSHTDDLPHVIGDNSQIHRVVMNLVMNAIESLRKGGRISISTHISTFNRNELAEMDLASDASPGKCVRIEVADDGCGMDPKTKARMIDPFFSTKFSGRD